jgi:hypothetical protein
MGQCLLKREKDQNQSIAPYIFIRPTFYRDLNENNEERHSTAYCDEGPEEMREATY